MNDLIHLDVRVAVHNIVLKLACDLSFYAGHDGVDHLHEHDKKKSDPQFKLMSF